MKISRLVSVLTVATFLIVTPRARAYSPTGGSNSASGGSSSEAAGASSTSAGSSAEGVSAPKADDGGCSIGKSHRNSGIALGVLGVALTFGLCRAKSRK